MFRLGTDMSTLGKWGVFVRSTAGLLLLTGAASSQANYESALIGGRSSLTGGTGVVSGTDAAAPLQNPATTVSIEGTSFVFSTFFVQLSGRRLDAQPNQVTQVDRGSDVLSQTQFRVLPTSTCLFFDLGERRSGQVGHHKFSVCIAEPESENFELSSSILATTNGERSGFQNRFISQEFSKKVYAAGWATTVSPGLSLGVTAMLEDVSLKDTEALATLVAETEVPSQALGQPGEQATDVLFRKAHSFGVSALVGLRYQLSDKFGMGLSLQTPTLPLVGSYSGAWSTESVPGDDEEYQRESGSARFVYPLRLALGVAGTLGKSRFEINGYFHSSRNDFLQVNATRDRVRLTQGQISQVDYGDSVVHRESTRPVANVGLGLEVPLRREWSLLFGFLTDFSGLRPRPERQAADAELFRNRTDLVHGSLGVAWTPPIGSLLFGTRFYYGEGELALADATGVPPVLQAYKQSRWGLSLVLSGQLSLQMLALADPTGLVKKATGEAGTEAKAP